jgi:osmoprotectant transport system permease protein
VIALVGAVIDWSWITEHLGEIGSRLVQHVWLTTLAVSIGLVLSLPLGVYAHRHPRAYGSIAAAAGVIYTIPSLALFVLLLPITGISTLTVEIALVSYTLLILIRNIVAGLQGVPSDVKESSLGMGYTEWQMLRRVELPLALPVIFAGIRVATVSTIGLITVASLLGKGGLGQFILEGLRTSYTNDFTEVIVGTVLSVALAVVADLALMLTGRAVTPWAGRRAGVAV